jgi:LuxR family transcriptional regulator, maltose regulon positive regulatory protein
MTTFVGEPVLSADREGCRLLDDKLRVPALGLAVTRRARVGELLEHAISRHRVTLVTGPAGAGKTVACASWADAQRRGSHVAWLTVDAGDREPECFWRYVVAALVRAGALGSAAAERLSRAGLEPGRLPAQLLGCLRPEPDATGPARGEAAGDPATLVIDDIHQLAGSDVLAGLDEFIRHAPAGLRLVLAGRHAPGLALAKLRVSGQIADIGAADLACTAQEADAYLAGIGALADRDTRAWLLRQTEGWMAGLRLLSMTLPPAAGPPAAGPPAAGPAGPGPGGPAGRAAAEDLVADYLSDEILAPLRPDVREFLLRTCLTEVVPTDLAHTLTGDLAAAAKLEQLSRENVLVRPVAAGHAEYRYHPMLRTVLGAILRREHPDEVPDLLGRIARWRADRGEVPGAIRAAAQAGDWDFAVLVLSQAAPIAPASADWAEFEAMLAGFPPDRRSREGVLAAALAAARLWQGDPDGALPHLDCARSALAKDGPGHTAAHLWLAALTVMRLAETDADLAGHWSLAGHAHEASRSVPEHGAAGLLWLALGCASLRRLEIPQARTALQHASSQLAAGGLTLIRERARSWEAVAHAGYGDLAAAIRVAAEVSEGPAGSDAELAPILALSQASAHLARDEPEAAAMLMDRADQAAAGPQPAGEPVVGVLSAMIRTRIAIDEGNLAGARGLIRLLTEAGAGDHATALAIAALDAEVSLAAGERERARVTLGGLADPAASRPDVLVCRARLLMADEDDKAAVKLLDPLLAGPLGASGPAAAAAMATTGEPAARPPEPAAVTLSARLSALLTTVIAHRRLNQAAEAAERLEEALALAEADDQSGVFIAGGSPVRSALTVLITPASRCAAFAGRILDRFDGRLPHGSGQPTGAALTESELAVLRFLPSHMTNQEIAEALFLSINTIKTHLSSVYRKLGVTSRRQAIAQGRRLDLL